MARHSFVRMSKLTDVKGRVDYISNPKRQEHLYATYSTVEPEFWQYLSEQAQHDFRNSNQPGGKCVEARELIIALPEALQASDPDLVLQLFAEKFREQYGVQCTAALHHNKSMTNYHIHLVFADRDILEKTEVKYATRNMYYDESGHHVRTKKEVLGEDGNLRPGCRMIPKGDPYDMKWFSGHKDIFKTRSFIEEVKVMYTDLINKCVGREEDRLAVFDPSGPYLATKKIGKNNPMAAEIRSDNAIRQKWNQAVDQVLIAGGTVEEVSEFKQEEVARKIADSMKEHGTDPGRLASIILTAIAVLKEFLTVLMDHEEPVQESVDTITEMTVPGEKKRKGNRPDSTKEEMAYHELEGIYQKLVKANRKLFALQKQRGTVQTALEQMPGGILYRKDRKVLQERIDGLDRQIKQTQDQMSLIPKQNGFESISAVKQAFTKAKGALEEVRRQQAEWDGIKLPTEHKPQTQKQKVSVLKQLAAKRIEADNRENHSSRPKAVEL